MAYEQCFRPGEIVIFIDAHVHLYDCFRAESLFNAACHNFRCYAKNFGDEEAFTGVLFLAETGLPSRFERELRRIWAGGKRARVRWGKWTVAPAGGKRSGWATADDGRTLLIIGGKQITTREKLEILSFFVSGDIENHLPIVDTISRIVSGQGVAIIPWGFGKWIGKRGRILSDLLSRERHPRLFTGDSIHRSALWPKPQPIRITETQGKPVLSGSDPLPLPGQELRAGRFGTRICCQLGRDRPVRCLKEALADGKIEKHGFGKPVTFFEAIRTQLALRRAKKGTECSAN